MKTFITPVAALAVALALAACASDDPDAAAPDETDGSTADGVDDPDPDEADDADEADQADQATEPDEVVSLEVAVLEAPSLTSFYAPIIDSQELDLAHGIDIEFVPKSTVALRTELANGAVDVSAGATVLTDVALLNQQGADTRYLFNVYDWWGTVATPTDSDIDEVTDLEGERVVGALSTTNYAMFKISAGLAGLDLDSLQENTAEPSGLIAAARSGRETAVQLWEPAHSVLTHGNDDFRALDLVGPLQDATGIERIPYVGVAAQQAWLEDNAELVRPLYDIFVDAAQFVADQPEQAAALISEATEIDEDAVADLLASPDRLALDVYPTTESRDELDVLLDAAVDYGILDERPDLDDLLVDADLR